MPDEHPVGSHFMLLSPESRLRRAFAALRCDRGLSLIEAVVAMAIFLGVSTALAGVLTSSISARAIATERTAAQQEANDQLEWIRSLDYADVGLTVDGNPAGNVDSSGNQSAFGGPTVPARYTVVIDIFWVDDAVPTAVPTRANYKNVVVTVSRARDGKILTTQSTQVGPRQRALYGGANLGIVNVQVQDYFTNAPFADALVRLTTGPSAPLGDRTNAAGAVRFPALVNASGTTYYDLVVAPFSGYILLPDPAATHFQLAAGATQAKVLRMYKPVTLTANFNQANGTPFVGTVVFTVANPRGSKSYTYTGTPVTITSITNSTTGASELLVPGATTITVTNSAASGFYAGVMTQNVPEILSDYPNDLDATTTLTADALGSIRATVTSAGGPVSGATVTVAGGPRSVPTATATTNASGIATFTGLPLGSGYTVTAAKGSWTTSNQSASVSGGSTTDVSFLFPTGSLKAVVTWVGVATASATVTLSGGPGAISLTGTSDVNGEVLFSNVPAGSGYTLSAVKSGQTGTASPTVVGATTTTAPVSMPTLSLVATITWVGANVSGATVTLSGGPLSLAATSATTSGPGQVTFTNVPRGSGYTLTASKNGQATTLTSQTFTTAPTTSVGVALPTGTIAVNAATWAGRAAGSALVTITGGPSGTSYSGTTDASGIVNVTVPATTATYPYTVTVTKNGGTGTATVTTLASGATATVTPVITPVKTLTLTIQAGGSTQLNKPITLSITGGPNGTALAAPAYGGAYTTSATGTIAISLPSGSGNYTVKAYVTGCSGSTNRSNNAGTSVSAGAGTPTATINMTSSTCAPPLP